MENPFPRSQHDTPPVEAIPVSTEFMDPFAHSVSEMASIVPDKHTDRVPIVGLGGSAGSIQALQTFFAHTPPDSGAAYVVVVHLSPDHESTLAELLQRSTHMPVVQVQDHTKVEINSVYVIPPAKQLSMSDGHLTLSDLNRPPGRRVAVDLFLRTLADTHGSSATAIILSGSDADGTIGMKRIKERGGLTIAQDPEQAQHDSMPRAAIETGMVDWILPVEAIPERLIAYRKTGERLELPSEQEPAMARPHVDQDANGSLRNVLDFLRVRTGRDFSYYKRATVLRRIARRMQVTGVNDLPAYLIFLRAHPGETSALLQDLLISVTNFFRDRGTFHTLQEFIPKLFEDKGPSDQVRVWTAACATGEEAYSIAFLLAEHAAKLEAPPQIQVFATDIDENAITFARQGVYPESIIADVSDERLHQFFSRERHGYRVKKSLRETVLFALHDVLKDAPFSRLDLVTCRNLLIYLNREAQNRAFEIFHFALRPGKFLFLGASESVEETSGLFIIRDKKSRIYSRGLINRPAPPLVMTPLRPGRSAAEQSPQGTATVANPETPSPIPILPLPLTERMSWGELHFKMLERIAPPSLIVDRHHNIVHLSERAGRFLHIGGGEPTTNLFRAVNPMLRLDLRAALFRASKDDASVEVTDVVAEIEGITRKIDLTVRPARDLAPDLMLIVFREREEISSISASPAPEPSAVVHQLEQELEHVKDQLRDTLEQHEAGTEELKASNEELQAMNEELRSATEELETSREELQSINEELTTVNLELKSKVDEASRNTNDLQNLMSATNIPTIFLDRDLCIKRYTPQAAPLFNLIVTDIGRPLSDLTPRLVYPEITNDARRVLEHLSLVERETSSPDGRWFLARLLPYRTSEDQIGGVVLTFVDITERKQGEEDLRQSSEKYRNLFSSIDEGFCVIEMIFNESQEAVDFRYLETNPAFAKLTGMHEAVGRKMLDLLPHFKHHWIEFFGEVSRSGKAMRADREGVNDRWFDAYAFRIEGEPKERVAVLFNDITERREAEETLRRALEEIEIAAKAKDHFLAVLSHELRTPLTPVLVTVASLERRTDLSSRVREGLDMIRRNVEIEAHFIDDLLDLTRITRNRFEVARKPMDIHEAILAAIDISQPDITSKDQKLTLALNAKSHQMTGDFARLQQVVWNLLKNASKFTPSQRNLHIATLDADDNRIRIVVSDNGMGIDAEVLPHIFNAFTQGGKKIAQEFGGLGLGLAISKATIDAHGGTIEAESLGKGHGAVFTVDLPLA